ncbi:hypothetical protein [Asanoa siamensis]|uniref:Uncharacterized protein n=1 Tax=Asanoa siamensis TaxID=926357 RepID=A0ABQ4CVV3_9ACTN|nr:hypothetical protein [Asanoa siamensis]GIF75419.1 hypothetical protein Asi02nite_49370 [Asanoa siamensis]
MTMIADAPPRPTTVTAAFWVQVGAVVLLLGLIGVVVAHAVYYDGLINEVAARFPDTDPADVSGERTGNVVGSVLMGGVMLIAAVLLAATAVPLLRGSNVARILVFVAGGVHLLFLCLPGFGAVAIVPFLLAPAPDFGPLPEDLPPEVVPWEESGFLDTLWARSSGSDELFFGGLSLGGLLEVALVVAIVLLVALPPASRYFVPRRPTPGYALVASVPPPPAYATGGMPYFVCPDPAAHYPRPPAPAAPEAAPPEHRP